MTNQQQNNQGKEKKRRYYKKGQIIWAIDLKKEVKVKSVNKEDLTITVLEKTKEGIVEHTFPLWHVDVLKYKAKEKLINQKRRKKKEKVTYFASVKGGVIPTKDEENAGRDCYARLEPVIREGKKVYELHIPRLTLAKIPLGFASYLDKEDFLSLKHERSSIGSCGLINVSGLIDSTYQGEVILQVVPLVADVIISSEVEEMYFDEVTNAYFIPYHKAICQAVVISQSKAKDKHISYDELLEKPSKRGIHGWGSTNK